MLVRHAPPRVHFAASRRDNPPPQEPPGSVGSITAKEAVTIFGAAAAGAVGAGIGGASAAKLGALVGIPTAILGEGLVGAAGGYMLVRGAHDGSVIGGMTMVGGAVGALSGAAGSISGAIAGALTGSPTAAIVTGAAMGALAGGGFATWLALGN